MKTWEDIRTSYVLGNITDAKDDLYQQSKTRIFKIILEALMNHYSQLPNGVTTTGDMVDLIKILQLITRN